MGRVSGVLLVAFVWAARAGPSVAETLRALRPLFLHVEESALEERAAPEEPLVQVDEDEFRALSEKWEAAAKARAAALEALAPKPAPPPPAPRLPPQVTRVELTGAVS